MDDWEKQNNEYLARQIIALGPILCDEYKTRDYTGKYQHSATATSLGSDLGNPTAVVSDAFNLSMNKARDLVSNGNLDFKLKEDLGKTLLHYYAITKCR